MLQTEEYLYDRKLRSQTFIVQATGLEWQTWPGFRPVSLSLPRLYPNLFQMPNDVILSATKEVGNLLTRRSVTF